MSETYHEIDTGVHNFVRPLLKLFESTDLDFLHTKTHPDDYRALFARDKDSQTIFHEKFYNELRTTGFPELMNVYRSFIREVVAPLFPEEGSTLIYQKTPTFRAHLPRNVAVGAFHRDADYSHPEGEVNFIIPVNFAHDSACTIVESVPGAMDFHQFKFHPSMLIQFNGNKCLHGNLPNLSGRTRISLDFRVLPRKFYTGDTSKTSVTKGVKFTIGEYYEEMDLERNEPSEP